MISHRMPIKAVAMTAVCMFVTLSSHAKADITISDPVSGPPATSGDGLSVDYYKTGSAPGSIANALAFIASNSPDSTFISTGVGYPASSPGSTVDDSTSLSTYLGSDAASLSNASVGTNTLDDSIYHYTGFINITTANLTTTFALGSDDGSELSINGTQVIDNDGDHAFQTVSQTVDFTAPGLYAVDMISFEDGGDTGVFWTSTIGSPTGSQVEVPESVLFQSTVVPEPSSLLLLGVSVSLLLSTVRLRSNSSQFARAR
jgi:hypothetical protein